MRWHPVKVQLPLSINISVLHVLPLLCTQLVCVTEAGLCLDRSSLPPVKVALLKARTDYQWTLLLQCQSATSDKLTALSWQVYMLPGNNPERQNGVQ